MKTTPTDASVADFLASIQDGSCRADCREVVELMREVTGEEPVLWGPGMIGFGRYHYVYDSGREGDWFLTGVSPRKKNLTLYVMAGFDRYDELMGRLGTYKTGKSCLYLKRLDDVDRDILRALVEQSVEHMRKRYPTDTA